MQSGIYAIENTINNKVYIGSAISIKRRVNEHKKLLRQDKHYNLHLQAAWNKYGKNAFIFCLIEYCDNEDLISKEQEIMDIFNVVSEGYNMCPNAGNNLGFRWSAEQKKAASGRIFTPERNMKISIALTGVKLSEYHRKRLSESHKGYVITEETKRKMSIAQKGERTGSQNHQYRHDLIRPLCIECGGSRIESSGRQWHCLECERYWGKMSIKHNTLRNNRSKYTHYHYPQCPKCGYDKVTSNSNKWYCTKKTGGCGYHWKKEV